MRWRVFIRPALPVCRFVAIQRLTGGVGGARQGNVRWRVTELL